MPREALLARTFVELADTLIDDFDVVDLLTVLIDRCEEVLEVSAAGLMLVSPEGDLRVMASSSDAVHLLELFQLQAQEGPCLDCFHTGTPVVNQDLAEADSRWPNFAPQAVSAGYCSVHALPMRLRGTVIGALNLFRAEEGNMSPPDVVAGQALADIATIAILQQSAAFEAQTLNQQLSQALRTRIVIEQAKGVVAESTGLEMDRSFLRLRNHARNHNRRLADVAQEIVNRTLAPDGLDKMPFQDG